MADANPPDNDDEETPPPRELTQQEKDLNELMQAVSVFVNKYTDPKELPSDGIVVTTHLGKIQITFGENPLRVVFMKQAMIQMACAYVTQMAANNQLSLAAKEDPVIREMGVFGEDMARQCFVLSQELWKKAETLQ